MVWIQWYKAAHFDKTYVAGSNILASMKHCVAMGGVGCWIGKLPAGLRFNAVAAAWGICRPVPANDTQWTSLYMEQMMKMC